MTEEKTTEEKKELDILQQGLEQAQEAIAKLLEIHRQKQLKVPEIPPSGGSRSLTD